MNESEQSSDTCIRIEVVNTAPETIDAWRVTFDPPLSEDELDDILD